MTDRAGSGNARRVIVVGAGISGSAAAARLCELGVPVTLMSLAPARHAPSTAAQDGFNASLDLAGEGDHPERHFEDCVRAGDGLCHHPPLRALVEAAPDLFERVCRSGVSFEHSPGGRLVQRRASGSRYARTAYSGSATGRALLDVLDDELGRWATRAVADEPLLGRLDYWELIDLVRDDDGVVVGVVAEDQRSGRIKAWPADAVCLGTGGYAALFRGSAASPTADGAALGIASCHGAIMANAELVQFEPTTVIAGERAQLVGELLRGAGARLWVPKSAGDARRPTEIPVAERDYLLERLEPELGNLTTADRASRAIETAYLDVRGLDPAWLSASLGRLLQLVGLGHDPANFSVAPRAHRSLGGLWVDYESNAAGRLAGASPRHHATNLPGLYAVGEAACQYHGACRLGGQALLESLFGGRLAAEAMASYWKARDPGRPDARRFERAEAASETARQELGDRRNASEDPGAIRAELGRVLSEHAGIERSPAGLRQALASLDELDARFLRVRVSDESRVLNQSVRRVRALGRGLALGRVLLESARMREEGRGSEPPRQVLTVAGPAGEVRRVERFEYRSLGDAVEVTDAVDTTAPGG
jgi:succinate dehydrogenase / fumarate reductase, flavoprotein subunit